MVPSYAFHKHLLDFNNPYIWGIDTENMENLEDLSSNIDAQLSVVDRIQISLDSDNPDFLRDNWCYISKIRDQFAAKGYNAEIVAHGSETMVGGNRWVYSLVISRRKQ